MSAIVTLKESKLTYYPLLTLDAGAVDPTTRLVRDREFENADGSTSGSARARSPK